MAVRKPLVNLNGVESELPLGDQLGGLAPAIANGQAATYEQIGARLPFATTLANGTTISRAVHGRNTVLPVNGGTINLPLDTDWAVGDEYEFLSVGVNATTLNWTGFVIQSQDTGALASQVIGGGIGSGATIRKMAAGVAYLFVGSVAGINAIATTLGSNPLTPAATASDTYTFVSTAGLVSQAFYAFSGVTGIFQITAISGNTATLLNINATAGATIASGTKLAPSGAVGPIGAAGTPGTPGTPGVAGFSTIAGASPPATPGIGLTANYTVDSAAPLSLQQYYTLGSISGFFLLTAISGAVVTLQNITAPVGAIVTVGAKLLLAGNANPYAAYEGALRYELFPGTTNTLIGTGGTPTTAGTLAAGTLATTNTLTQARRMTMSTSATAGGLASMRTNPAMVWRGNGPGKGGFRFVHRWGTEILVVGNRVFVGVTDSTATPANVDPLTIAYAAAKVGLAANINGGNYQLVNNAVGAAPTVLDLGPNFPVNQTGVPDLELRALPNASGIEYIVTDKATGLATSGILTANIPGNTVFLTPVAWMTNNATAAAALFSHIFMKLTAPN